MSAPPGTADAQRMLAAMHDCPITCFNCAHLAKQKSSLRRWCAKYDRLSTWDTRAVANTCPHFLWDPPP